ncbi:MAG: branched-chain amino acid ABC transporter permease, partial [Desulfobacterales bacterium]|nr:branched-chain amino acid ABC transporter permease [Desulfobacterales bacterium]
SFYAHYVTLISPHLFTFEYMITLLIMVLGGGRNTVAGPIVGALIFTLLPEMLRAVEEYRMLVFGILLILIIMYMPRGIVPQCQIFYRLMLSKLSKNRNSSVTLEGDGIGSNY